MLTANHQRPHRFLLESKPDTPPTDGTRTLGSYPNGYEANFDTNMVIILAALLCALICVLGLNSIVRYAIRCSHRFGFGRADETAARLASTGLKKSFMRQIPVSVYGSGGMNIIPATDCPICLGEFVNGEKVRVLPSCKHGFHLRCIDTWLVSHSSCPICRQSLIEPAAAGSDDVGDGNHGTGSGGGGMDEVVG